MNNLDLKKSSIFRAVKLDRNILFRRAYLFKKIFLILFLISLLFILMGPIFIEEIKDNILIGITFIFLFLSLLFFQIETFFEFKTKHPKIKVDLGEVIRNPDKYNLSGFFSFKVARALYRCFKKKSNSSSLFLYYLLNDPDFIFIFSRSGVNLTETRIKLKNMEDEDSDELYELIKGSLRETHKRGGKRLKKNDVIVFASNKNPLLKDLFSNAGITSDDIKNLSDWIYRIKNFKKDKKKFWKWKNLIKKGSIAKDWASGYTVLLDRFSTNLTKLFKKSGFPEIIGHDEEIKNLERILSREETNNALLVGEPGTGRKSMIWELTRRSFFGESLPDIINKKIIDFDLSSLVSSINDSEKIEKLINKIFREVEDSGNTILVINNIHEFLERNSKPGRFDISGIIAPYLSSRKFKFIGITDYQNYRKEIEKNHISSFFEKIEVSEISIEETIRFLQIICLKVEHKNKKRISYQAIKEIIRCGQKYMASDPSPRKEVNILEEAIAYINQLKEKVLLPEHISMVVSRKTNIPIGGLKQEEKKTLLNLEELINKRVINQQEAVKEVCSALRRSRAEISSDKKPMGSFLFLGPTGVGKTETAKTLSDVYFGSVDRMIRIDMSEFQTLNDIQRLIGSSDYEGILTTKIKQNPFSLILLDEIEKAHPDILNIFLQILDEGHVTDGNGIKINFKNSIIIATSNAGSSIILDSIEEGGEWSKVKEALLKILFSESIFRPEFINRFDAVALFSPLDKESLLKITDLFLEKIKNKLKDKNINLIINEDIKERIVEIGYDPKFGAREIRRVIQDKIENSLATSILSSNIKSGDNIEINPDDFTIKKL
jgi:ATP-dependent Clp protease ATP-binding subunit ClpC